MVISKYFSISSVVVQDSAYTSNVIFFFFLYIFFISYVSEMEIVFSKGWSGNVGEAK